MHHQTQKAHHGGAALVELNGTLLELGLGIERVPAEVNGAVAEVTREFTAGDVLHDGKLQEANEGQDLQGTGHGGGEGAGPAGGDVGELSSVQGDVTREADSGGGGQVADNTQHADAAVLDLNVSEAVELGLVAIRNQSQRVEESERSLGAELVLEGHAEGRSLGRLLRRGEGSSGGNKGGGDGELHGFSWDLSAAEKVRPEQGYEKRKRVDMSCWWHYCEAVTSGKPHGSSFNLEGVDLFGSERRPSVAVLASCLCVFPVLSTSVFACSDVSCDSFAYRMDEVPVATHMLCRRRSPSCVWVSLNGFPTKPALWSSLD